jgi:hypothetical protein
MYVLHIRYTNTTKLSTLHRLIRVCAVLSVCLYGSCVTYVYTCFSYVSIMCKVCYCGVCC